MKRCFCLVCRPYYIILLFIILNYHTTLYNKVGNCHVKNISGFFFEAFNFLHVLLFNFLSKFEFNLLCQINIIIVVVAYARIIRKQKEDFSYHFFLPGKIGKGKKIQYFFYTLEHNFPLFF